MAWVATHGQNSREMVSERPAKAARSGLLRRLRGVRDISLLLTAWLGSWALVVLVARGLWGIL